MSRAKKNTVDYFPHNCKHGKTLKIFESKFNHGYRFWFKLLELLGDSPDHYYDYKTEINRLWLAEYCLGIDNGGATVATEMLDYLAILKAIDQELWENDRIIWSQNFVDNLETVYNKRTTDLPKRPKGGGNPSQIAIPQRKSATDSHSAEKTSQRKGKKSKLNNKSVADNSKNNYRELVKLFYREKHQDLPKYIRKKVDDLKIRDKEFDKGVPILEKLNRLDGYNLKEIKATLLFAIRDEFWSGNLYAISSRLRGRDKDGLHKFDKIYQKLKDGNGVKTDHRKREEALRHPIQNDRSGAGFQNLKKIIANNLED